MSKKIASGTDALVIDVKTGSGAFMKTLDDSRALAHALVEIGKGVGMDCMAIISDMNQPLGNAIGNALEIQESIDILKGEGPQDITDLVLTLGAHMVVMAKLADDLDTARAMCERTITDGSALAKFGDMIAAQGGDRQVIDHPEIMPQATYQIALPAKTSGVVSHVAADEMGVASMLLGGGRQKADDQLDYAVGIMMNKKIGDAVEAGEPLLTIYSNREDVDDIKELLYQNITISDHADPVTLIHETIR